MSGNGSGNEASRPPTREREQNLAREQAQGQGTGSKRTSMLGGPGGGNMMGGVLAPTSGGFATGAGNGMMAMSLS